MPPNGKAKLIIGIVGAIFVSLLGWNFLTVQALQISEGRMEDRLATIRTDFEAQRAADVNFQAEIRGSLQISQSEMRSSVQRIADILTEVRVRLGGTETKHK